MSPKDNEETREGVPLTNLDQPLSPDAGATKRDLVNYLDAVADRMLPGLAGRALTVLRVLRGQSAFMQKNVPKYAPDWVRTVAVWAEASSRAKSILFLPFPPEIVIASLRLLMWAQTPSTWQW